MRLVHCAGTATDVGKTWVGAAVLASLRARGLRVAARKPAQSFDPPAGAPGAPPTDAEVLAAATGEPVDRVCRPDRCYPVAMAPPMAADVLGRAPIAMTDLVAELDWSAGHDEDEAPIDLGWVEGVGGPRSPIAHDGDGVDLALALRPDVIVLVADAGLGTINAVLLSVEAYRSVDAPVVVVLNRYHDADDLHVRNHDWLRQRCGLDVVTTIEAVADRLTARP